MYIVKWLTKHPLIAIWVLGAIAILLTRSSWQDSHDAEQEGHQIAAETTQQVEIQASHAEKDGDLAGQTAKVSSVQTVEKDSAESDVTGNGQAPAASTVEAPSSEVTVTTGDAAERVESGADNADASPQETASAPESLSPTTALDAATTTAISATEKTKAVEPADASAGDALADAAAADQLLAVSGDLSQSSNEDLLLMAREAYWNNGLEEAAEIYTQLIELEPQVMEHKGELGNVFWRQGHPEKAAELYSQIAIPMIKKGDGERVANMIGFIGLFFPDRATEINRQLQAHSGSD